MASDTQRWASPETLAALSDYPCLRCLSDHQLLILLALLLCRIVSTDPDNECTAGEMVDTAHCFSCFSDRQLLQMTVAIIATYAVENGYVTNVDTLIEEGVCLNCVDPKQIRGMLVDQVQKGIINGTLFPVGGAQGV